MGFIAYLFDMYKYLKLQVKTFLMNNYKLWFVIIHAVLKSIHAYYRFAV